jgi:hypothetical protein
MNLRWFRDNLIVVIAGVVFLAILGGSVWFLRQATAQQATVLTELEGQQRDLQQLRDSAPYPSNENIDIVKLDREKLRNLYAKMQQIAARPPVIPPELERDIEFSQLMRQTVDRLDRLAQKHRVRVPDGFAYGFSRYDATFPCRNPALASKECKKLLALLAKQLLVIEKLSTLLIDNKVDEITAIRHTEVEKGASSDTLDAPISNEDKALYHTYPFELHFMCDTDTLRRFLNDLMQADSFFVVRSIKIDSTASRIKAAAPTETETPGTPPPTPVLENQRLNIILRLDLIEFLAHKPPTGKS